MGTKHLICFCLITTVFFCCKTDPNADDEAIAQAVSQLETFEEKQAFLENILLEVENLDRRKRYLSRGGLNIDPKALNEIRKTENAHLTKIQFYFESYGYPSRPELGNYAAFAPIAVAIYTSDMRGIKENQFKYFYGAYRFNDVPQEMFLEYLKVFYEKKTGDKAEIDKSKSTDVNISTLIDALGYET